MINHQTFAPQHPVQQRTALARILLGQLLQLIQLTFLGFANGQLEALVVPVIEATVHVAGLAQSFSRTGLAPISVSVPDEEDE